MLAMPKNMLKTSFLSEAQATDSTRRGCRAKNAAAKADGHRWFVVLYKNRNNKMTVPICNKRLTR